jgi:predicted Zn-dependent peptidase
VESEKENLKQIIEGKIDNKNLYATDRCIEEIYTNQPYGLFKYGYTEDLKNINAQNLYEYYINLINKSKIDIFISGDISEGSIDNLKNNINLNKLNERNANYLVCETNVEKKKTNDKINLVEEKMQINQGKLVIGLDTYTKNTDASIINNPIRKFATSVYNIILGGSANSKLFQNVREKESLAYTASSNYIRVKDLILIKAGIEIENYNKAVSLIKEQLEQIKKEEFSDEEVENAKKLIISTVESIPDSQDSEITYYFSQELSSENISIDEYINNIRKVSKKDVVLIANEIAINTIYFLRN